MGCGGPPSDWLTFEPPNRAFSVHYPRDWSAQQEADFALLSSPSGDVTLGISSYLRPGSTLTQFATARMSVDRTIFPTASPLERLTGTGWEAITENSLGRVPGEQRLTQRRMLCAQHGQLFISLTLYSSPSEYKRNRNTYEAILTSLRFTPSR